jgi:hypothetical protein
MCPGKSRCHRSRPQRLDVTRRNALGVQRDHVPAQTVQPALTLAHRHQHKARVAVPRHSQLDRADVGGHGLGVRAVTRIARAPASRVVSLVAKVVGHLHLEAGLQGLARQSGQQPVVAGQLDTLAAGPLDQFGRPSRIAGSSPTDDTLRPTDLAGSELVDDETESEEVVVTGDPLRPATLGRGPSDHPRLHTPSDCPKTGSGRPGSASVMLRTRRVLLLPVSLAGRAAWEVALPERAMPSSSWRIWTARD